MFQICSDFSGNNLDLLTYAYYFANQIMKSIIALKKYDVAINWGNSVAQKLGLYARKYHTPIFT